MTKINIPLIVYIFMGITILMTMYFGHMENEKLCMRIHQLEAALSTYSGE